MVTREQLYAQVWSEPMTKVGERYGVSGSYLARVCVSLNVPRPPRGYWAKLAVGKAPPQDPLPALLPGDAASWNEKGGPLPVARAPSPPPSVERPRRRKTGQVASTEHPLIRNYRGEFLRTRPKEAGGYLKPYKRLLPHVVSSEACLDYALSIASKLYNQLEAVGARVLIAPADRYWHYAEIDEREAPKEKRDRYYQSAIWSPGRPTVAFFEDAAIAITIVEMTEDVLLRYVGGDYIRETKYQANLRKYRHRHTWTTTKPLPSGRLKLVASAAEGVEWSLTWQETPGQSLEGKLARIAQDIRRAVPQIAALVEEARRQAEIRRQEWEAAEQRRRQEEDRRRVEESIKQSRQQLGQVIERWRERMAVERFLDELAERIERLPPEERAEMAARLQLARDFMGAADTIEFFRAWKTPEELYQSAYPPITGRNEGCHNR